MKSRLEALLREFWKNNTRDRLNSWEDSSVRYNLEWLFKYASLVTLTNVFQEFQVIYELLNTVLV